MDKESRLDYRQIVRVLGETYCMAQNIYNDLAFFLSLVMNSSVCIFYLLLSAWATLPVAGAKNRSKKQTSASGGSPAVRSPIPASVANEESPTESKADFLDPENEPISEGLDEFLPTTTLVPQSVDAVLSSFTVSVNDPAEAPEDDALGNIPPSVLEWSIAHEADSDPVTTTSESPDALGGGSISGISDVTLSSAYQLEDTLDPKITGPIVVDIQGSLENSVTSHDSYGRTSSSASDSFSASLKLLNEPEDSNEAFEELHDVELSSSASPVSKASSYDDARWDIEEGNAIISQLDEEDEGAVGFLRGYQLKEDYMNPSAIEEPKKSILLPEDMDEFDDLSDLDTRMIEDRVGRLKHQQSMIKPLRKVVGCTRALVHELDKKTKPHQEALGKMAVNGAAAVTQTVHDTTMDVFDTVEAIPWRECAVSLAVGAVNTVKAAGQLGYTGAVNIINSPVGQRAVGAVDTTVTNARLGLVNWSLGLLSGIKTSIDGMVESLDSKKAELNDRLNPYGLPRGQVVVYDDELASNSHSHIQSDESGDDDM